MRLHGIPCVLVALLLSNCGELSHDELTDSRPPPVSEAVAGRGPTDEAPRFLASSERIREPVSRGAPNGRVLPRATAPALRADMAVVHDLRFPTRVALGPQGRVYVSDAEVGSVFILDEELQPVGEIKDLGRPLGVAVDTVGRIYVGRHDLAAVEVYDADGALLFGIDEGGILMPNDLALDADGNLYVADSRADQVKVYEPDGRLVRTIGDPEDGFGGLRFPASVTVAYRRSPEARGKAELYVADQGNFRVRVFDLDGTPVRAFGSAVEAFSADWRGRFVKVQSLEFDGLGRLLVADAYLNRVQLLDPATGSYLGDFGGPDSATGRLALPLDLVVTSRDEAIVASARSGRLERFPAGKGQGPARGRLP